jgi:hypothetical protein
VDILAALASAAAPAKRGTTGAILSPQVKVAPGARDFWGV